MSKVINIQQVTPWIRALNAARQTVGKSQLPDNHKVSSDWEAKMLLAEHSPIRLVEYDWKWEDIKQWVTTHLVRHHEGCEKFVHSQRDDRRENPVSRDEMPQGSLNDMLMSANAQSLINISRKRLCSCASPETREAWKQVKTAIQDIDPVLASKMVPECIYRGFCPELKSCGYYKTPEYVKRLQEYRKEAIENHENARS